jgi:tetratricopeptide (TPR) repeat protein
LWREPVLGGVDSAALRPAVAALAEERMGAVEECLEVELGLGESRELISEITDLVRRHPYREGLHGALMLALYRAGRAADALAAFRRARALLRDDLGTEPGEGLQRLHQAILRQDASLGVPEVATARVPRELPVQASCFTGREQEAARVRAVLASSGGRRPAVALLYGPGGVGKSALAVRVGHELAASFPDGQLHVDLCGATPGLRPVAPAEGLGRLLRSLGVHPREVPASEADAAALFRSVTAGRPLLLVLDNAADAAQVAPLVPAAASCSVLVTSRHPLPALDVDDRLRLDGLPAAEGLALLRGLAGGRAVAAPAGHAIVAASGGLPLAIRIAAGRLAVRPDLPEGEYAERLADASRRLDELTLGDLDVRSCIQVGYDTLRDADPVGRLAARAFRALGILKVPDVAPGVVAAMLAETDTETARTALDRLVAAQLVEPVAGGRYRLHDLVRLVAAERAQAEETDADRAAILERALACYTMQQVDTTLRPGVSWIFELPAPLSGQLSRLPPLDAPALAREWISAELPALVALAGQVCSGSDVSPESSRWLTARVLAWLHNHCEWQAARRLAAAMAETAALRQEPEGVGGAHLLLGRCEADLGNFTAAETHLQEALAAMRARGNHRGLALTLNALGVVAIYQEEPETALTYYLESLKVTQQHRLTPLQAVLYVNLSSCYVALGQLDAAIAVAEAGIALTRKGQRSHALSSALNNLAAARCLGGDLAEAERYVLEALTAATATGDQRVVREVLIMKSEVELRRGRLADADECIRLALRIIQAEGDRYGEAPALRQRAKVLAATDRWAEAQEMRAQAAAAYARATARRDNVLEILLAQTEPDWAERRTTGFTGPAGTPQPTPVTPRST